MVRYAMVIDLKKCLGCNACTVACKAENSVPAELKEPDTRISWNVVLTKEFGRYPNVSRLYVPRPCMHCDNPLCVKVCPVGATYKRDDGIVAIDYDRCIGCRYCVVACPYGARYFNWKKPVLYASKENPDVPVRSVGVVEKCTFCIQRVTKGRLPACVETCVGEARYFGDLDDPKSEVSRLLKERRWIRLLEELNTEPQVYYLI